MTKMGLTVALVLLLATGGALAQCGGDFNLFDLLYLRDLQSTFLPIFRQHHETRTQFAAMGFDFAGFHWADSFLPATLTMGTRNRINYAMATFREYGNVRRHAEENLMWAITDGGMMQRYRDLYGHDPRTIHLFTARTPCRNCVNVLINTLSQYASTEIHIGFNEYPEGLEIFDVEYAVQEFGRHERFHFFPRAVCEYVDNYEYSGEASPTPGPAPGPARTPRDELRRRRRSVSVTSEECPISPNLYRHIHLTSHQRASSLNASCLPQCDADISCAGVVVRKTGGSRSREVCSTFTNPSETPRTESKGTEKSTYVKVSYPAPGFWFTIRNKGRQECLSSRRDAGNALNYATCNARYENQHYQVVNPEAMYVTIKARNNHMCVQAEAWSTPSFAPDLLTSSSCSREKQEQQWQVQRQADQHHVRLINRRHGGCLSLSSLGVLGGAQCRNDDDQSWSLDVITTEGPPDWFLIEGEYGCLYSRATDDTFSWQTECRPDHHDQWFREWRPTEGDGTMLKSKDTGKCLSATGKWRLTHATCDPGNNKQRWKRLRNGLLISVQYDTCVYHYHKLRLANCNDQLAYHRWVFRTVQTGIFGSSAAEDSPTTLWFTIKGRYGCLFSRASDDTFSWNTACRPDYQDQSFRVWRPTENDIMLKSKDTGKCLSATGKWDLTHATCDPDNNKQRWKRLDTGLLISVHYGTCVYHYHYLGLANCNAQLAYQRWEFNPIAKNAPDNC